MKDLLSCNLTLERQGTETVPLMDLTTAVRVILKKEYFSCGVNNFVRNFSRPTHCLNCVGEHLFGKIVVQTCKNKDDFYFS